MSIRACAALCLLMSTVATPLAAAPVPKEQLLVPPANADHYVVFSSSAKHGDIWRWTQPDGSLAFRHSQSLRGWITETDEVLKLDAAGLPASIVVRGFNDSGDQGETFLVSGGTASWKNDVEEGSGDAKGRYYTAKGGPWIADAQLIDLLAAAGPTGVDILPSGHATLAKAKTISVPGPRGPENATLAFISGLGMSPSAVWLDAKDHFLGFVGDISVLPAGYEKAAEGMRKVEDDATSRMVLDIAHRMLTPAAKAPVLFDHVELFDSVNGRFIADRAVMVSGGKVAAVGAGGSLKAPKGARTVDGRGKSLVPGLWDAHRHLGDDWNLLGNVATGILNYRSPGSLIDRAQSVVARRAKGDLIAPDGKVQVILDRKDPLAAQGALTASSEAEAISQVRKIKAAGMWGVKFYTSMNPAWIAPAAAEAHRLGLHVSGHVPAGMRPLDAVRAGYDEVTHINFSMMQAMPQAVVDKANTAARLEGPAQYGNKVDLKSPAMRAFVAELARRKTVIDPTLVVFEPMMTNEGSAIAPPYAAFAKVVPATVVRGMKGGGYPLFGEVTRADMKTSFAKMVELVGDMHRAGVPIVAGTDGGGMELVREIELYKTAGMTNGEALQTATIVPARMVGMDKTTGSIAVGKDADLLLVDGLVSNDLGALRRIDTVVMDGAVMAADALRSAAGFSGRPD